MSLLNRLLRRDDEMASSLSWYLRDEHVPFSLHHHAPAYTAQQLAQIEHVPGRMVAKVVIAFADDQMVMLCLPAPCRVNLLKLMDVLCTDNVRLATEAELARAFPDCEVGAMPPFGNLYRMPVFVDQRLTMDDRIHFNAGRHTDTMEMAYPDFARLVHPLVGDFC
jgi:Ala-tRNA(Pro) deacylase